MTVATRLSVIRSTFSGPLLRSIVVAALAFAAGGCQTPTDNEVPDDGVIPGTEFAIANSATDEDFGGLAHDGTNYLVAVQGRTTSGQSTVAAQLVSPAGALIGSQIVVPGGTGDPARIAFDGTNYLMVWASVTFSTTVTIAGQFVSKTGAFVGSPFTIATGTAPAGGVSGMAFGGGSYFIAYAFETGSGEAAYTSYGRLVSPAGALGSQLTLATNTTEGFHSVAFDGTRFLTVFVDGLNVRGRFTTTAGVMSTEFTIYTVPSPATQGLESVVTVGFNGTDYLVTLGRHSTTTSSDAFAQVVSSAGANVGGLITIADDPSNDEFPVGAVSPGGNFLVSYLDKMSIAGQGRVRGRFVSAAAAAVGPAFTLAAPAAGKVPLGGAWHYAGGKYFLYLTRGIPSSSDPSDFSQWTQTDVFGALLTIPSP